MANRSGLDEADSGAADHRVTTEEDGLLSRRRQAAAVFSGVLVPIARSGALLSAVAATIARYSRHGRGLD